MYTDGEKVIYMVKFNLRKQQLFLSFLRDFFSPSQDVSLQSADCFMPKLEQVLLKSCRHV